MTTTPPNEPEVTDSVDDEPVDDVADELPARAIRGLAPSPRPAVQRRLSEALAQLGMDTESTDAVVRAVESPDVVLSQLRFPAEFGVHGGTIRYVTCRVRVGAVLPIPTNPRVAARVRYAASESGDGIEPLATAASSTSACTLVLTSDSVDSLRRDMDLVSEQIAASNDLVPSVRSQGVLLPVTVIPVTFHFRSGEPTRTVLCTVDGSSRLTAAMRVWGLSYSDVLLGSAPGSAADNTHTRIEELLGLDAQVLTEDDKAKLRNQVVPANILVGWDSDLGDSFTLPQVLDAYLGLIHVEPPTPWSEAAGQDKRADVSLDELERLDRISETRRKYLAGLMPPTEAEEMGLDPTLDGRAAEIFYEIDRRANANAVNRALRRIGKSDPNRDTRLEVATELALRPYRRSVTEQQRRNPRLALPSAMQRLRPDGKWSPTLSSADELLEAGLAELGGAEPGAAARELAVRGAFWLTRYSALQKSSRTDTRFADELLEHVLGSAFGLRVLHRAVVDGRAGVVPRQIRDDGSIVTTADQSTKPIDDRWLRVTFPPPVPPELPEEPEEPGGPISWTPRDELRSRIYAVRDDALTLRSKVFSLSEVEDEGRALVEVEGVPRDVADEVTSTLRDAQDRVTELGIIWRMASGPEGV